VAPCASSAIDTHRFTGEPEGDVAGGHYGIAAPGIFHSVAFATLVAQAETGKPAPINRHAPAVLTGKERLGPKWTDEQRIDNCNVPVDKRGNKPRPSICANAPPS